MTVTENHGPTKPACRPSRSKSKAALYETAISCYSSSSVTFLIATRRPTPSRKKYGKHPTAEKGTASERPFQTPRDTCEQLFRGTERGDGTGHTSAGGSRTERSPEPGLPKRAVSLYCSPARTVLAAPGLPRATLFPNERCGSR